MTSVFAPVGPFRPRTLFTAALIAASLAVPAVQAQTAPSGAKKDLIARILKAQQAGIDAMARQLAEEPAAELLERAAQALPQRVAADKRETVARDIQADAKKYADEAVPVVQAAANKLAPSTVGAMLDQRMSEEELRTVATLLESPAYAKFQQLAPELQKALGEKLVADTRTAIEPKVKALETTIGRRLGVDAPTGNGAPAAAPAPAARPPARGASR